MFEKGQIVKLSQEGLDWCYKYQKAKRRLTASKWQWEFCKYDDDGTSVTVKRIPTGFYQHYHRDFIELASKVNPERG